MIIRVEEGTHIPAGYYVAVFDAATASLSLIPATAPVAPADARNDPDTDSGPSEGQDGRTEPQEA